MSRRIGRWLGIALLALGLVGVGLTWYVNHVFLPGPARRWIATQLAEQTGRRVQLGALRFRLWEGLTIDEIVIFEDRRYGDQPFLTLDRLTVHGPMPTLTLVHPRLRLVRDAAQVWNAESLRLFHRTTPSGAARHPWPLLARLAIRDGELLIEDQGRAPGLDATLTDLNLRAALNLPNTLSLRGTAHWQTVPVTALLVQGTWNLRTAAGEGSVTARQFPLETVRPYLPAATAAALREVAGAATITVKGAVQARQLELTAALTAPDARLQWRPAEGAAPWQIAGDCAVTGHGVARRGADDAWGWDPPTGAVEFRRLAVTPPAPWPAVEQLDGALRVTPTTVQTDRLTAVVRGVPVRLHGTATADRADRWPQAALAVELEADGPLETLWQAAAPYRGGWLATAQVTGAHHLHGTIGGTVRAPKPSAALTVQDARITGPGLEAVESLEGRIVIEPNLLTAAGLRATWRTVPIQLDGTLVNFSAPEISGRVTAGEITADVALAIAGPHVTVNQLTATYRKSEAAMTGTLRLGETVTGTLRTRFSVDAADGLSLLPAAPAKLLHNWQPAGRLKGDCAIEGPLQDPRRVTGQLSLHAGEFTVRGLRLENLVLEYRQRDGQATLSLLTALLYGGTVTATGTLRLDDPQGQGPFTAQCTLAHLELGRLARELAWNDQQVSGQVTGDCQLRGAVGAMPASLDGQGRLQVTNGRLFELPLLKGLADILGAPALRRVVFRDAAGTFALRGDRVTTDDLTVYGDLATLTATGTVTLGGGLEARALASIDPTAFEHSPDFARKAGQFLHQAGYLVGEIKLGGTLAQPTYEVVPVSLNRILKDQVLKRLGGLLGGLLQ